MDGLRQSTEHVTSMLSCPVFCGSDGLKHPLAFFFYLFLFLKQVPLACQHKVVSKVTNAFFFFCFETLPLSSVSEELSKVFTDAVSSGNVRILRVSIVNGMKKKVKKRD